MRSNSMHDELLKIQIGHLIIQVILSELVNYIVLYFVKLVEKSGIIYMAEVKISIHLDLS